MQVRLAEREDAELIARVHVQAWRETYEGLMPNEFLESLSFTKRLALWTDVLGRPAHLGQSCVCLDEFGEICGFAHVGVARDECFIDFPELYSIHILRKNQKKGLGVGMLTLLASTYVSLGGTAAQFYAWVLRGNPSVSWYQRMGGRKMSEKLSTLGGVRLIEDAYRVPWPASGVE